MRDVDEEQDEADDLLPQQEVVQYAVLGVMTKHNLITRTNIKCCLEGDSCYQKL